MSKFESSVMFASFFLSLNAIYLIFNLNVKVTALEQRPELELTCSIKDNQGRYVCRYVEIEEMK